MRAFAHARDPLFCSFTTSSPFPLSFSLFLHIPFLNFAFCLNSVSEGNWEHVGLSGPIIFSLKLPPPAWPALLVIYFIWAKYY